VLGGQLSAQQLEEEPAPEQELQYDDSSVRQYVCEVLAAPPTATDASGGGRVGVFEAAPPGTQVSGFRRLSGCLHDPALARAYSVDWRPGLVAVSEDAAGGMKLASRHLPDLAPFGSCGAATRACDGVCPSSQEGRALCPTHAPQAGGKDGVVSVLGSAELEGGGLAPDTPAPPLLSHKLHRGWVSDVQFASAAADSSGGDRTPLLLTAGNDGVAALWDLGRVATEAGGRGGAVPRCLARSEDLHSGDSWRALPATAACWFADCDASSTA
jgi:hypothetical protein